MSSERVTTDWYRRAKPVEAELELLNLIRLPGLYARHVIERSNPGVSRNLLAARVCFVTEFCAYRFVAATDDIRKTSSCTLFNC